MHKSLIILLTGMISLNGCGSGSGTDTAGRGGEIAGLQSTLSISITDAVVDSAEKVVVQFTGITIKPANGDDIEYTFESPQSIDLLSLQGTLFTSLISDQIVPSGKYTSIRLHVNATDGEDDSFIELDDGSVHELTIPSGSQSGLKINSNFELGETQDLHLMIDFDLRKSVVVSNNQYKLRPTLRMINMDDVEHISGTIDATLPMAEHCINPTTGNAVYLFEGYDITADDIDNHNPNPVSSASVNQNVTNGDYEYTLAFMPPGEYTLAFTCQANIDNPENNDDIIFSYSENVTVGSSLPSPTINPLR